MIQILFGFVGFGYKKSEWIGKNVFGEDREMKSTIILLGVIGIIVNNWNMFNKWMYLLHSLSDQDIARLHNYEIEIDKRCKSVIEEREQMYNRWKDDYDISRDQTQKLLAEATTRVRDLETTLKVLKYELKGNI